MKPFTYLTTLTGVMAALALTAPAQAHRAWIKPSETVLSGEQNYVTFDAAVSNTLFVPEHVAYNTAAITVTAPDGNSVEIENASKGKYRSVFDVPLKSPGTYRIASASSGLRAFWRDEEGNRKMWPRRGGAKDGETYENSVPDKASELLVTYGSRRTETFVTLGSPSTESLQPSNQGLELVVNTHPNDLYATEQASFSFLIDGEPAAGVEIEIVRGSMRYRNASEALTTTTDEKGRFTVTWPEAGMYFVEASYSDDKAKAPATERRGSYSATFEVLPL